MTRPVYPIPPNDSTDQRQHRRQIALSMLLAMQGKINCVLDVTLANAAETVVKDPRLHPEVALLFDPLDEDAEEILRAGPLHVTAANRRAGECAITHEAASAGAAFRMVVLG